VHSPQLADPRLRIGDAASLKTLAFQPQAAGATVITSAPRDLGRKLRTFERSRPWLVYSDDEKPNRVSLARALVISRDLDLSDQLAATINRELESLWGALTRPRGSGFQRCDGCGGYNDGEV
jgi:hypothetical protein